MAFCKDNVMCDLLVTHGPYLSALGIKGLYTKRYVNSSVYLLTGTGTLWFAFRSLTSLRTRYIRLNASFVLWCSSLFVCVMWIFLRCDIGYFINTCWRDVLERRWRHCIIGFMNNKLSSSLYSRVGQIRIRINIRIQLTCMLFPITLQPVLTLSDTLNWPKL